MIYRKKERKYKIIIIIKKAEENKKTKGKNERKMKWTETKKETFTCNILLRILQITRHTIDN